VVMARMAAHYPRRDGKLIAKVQEKVQEKIIVGETVPVCLPTPPPLLEETPTPRDTESPETSKIST
jgi:hypothetical protein